MKKLISIVIPALNEESNVEAAYVRLQKIFEALSERFDFELIFTDNHSNDRTFEIIRDIAAHDPRIRAVRFARNVGYQRSILSGYLLSKGDAVIQLDCDLQDPPELIPEMIRMWEEGNDVVYGIRRSRKEGFLITLMRRAFYKIVDALSEDSLPQNAGDFRLVDKKLVKVLGEMRSKSPYLRGQIAAAGFRQKGFEYDRSARTSGETKFSLGSLVKLSADAIVSHSVLPLRLAAYVGFFFTFMSIIAIFGYFAVAIVSRSWPPGFATLVILGFLNIGIVSLFLGILGEYFIRVIEQVTIGPISIIEDQVNMPIERIEGRRQILYA